MNVPIPAQPADLYRLLVETVSASTPGAAAWLPLAGLIAAALGGIVLLLRGAVLAPGVAATAFAAAAGGGGALLARVVGLPLAPVAAVGAVLGAFLSFALFRVWLALLLSLCMVGGALSVYYVRVLTPYAADYTSDGLDRANGLVTLERAAAGGGERNAAWNGPASVFAYFEREVPGFRRSVTAIVLSCGAAGLIFGLFLPWAARSVWAATTGTLLLGVGLTPLIDAFWPSVGGALLGLGAWGWVIVAGVWVGSLVVNLRSRRRPAPPRRAAPTPAG